MKGFVDKEEEDGNKHVIAQMDIHYNDDNVDCVQIPTFLGDASIFTPK